MKLFNLKGFPPRIFRTLRFRLTFGYLVVFALLLTLLGFSITATLQSLLRDRSEEVLREEWAAIKGYLHFEDGDYFWYYDPSDPDEVSAVARLRRVFVLVSPQGQIRDSTVDPSFQEMQRHDLIQAEMKQARDTGVPIFKIIQGDEDGPYLIESGLMIDDKHQEWYLAIGRSIREDASIIRKFRRDYFLLLLPIALLISIAVSWYTTGRGLRSLQSVERAAQGITGSNLGLQIPLRGANDELDRLIETFNAMSGRLKNSFDQLKQFSTDASHELRTPLTAIQGQLEVALFTAKTQGELREAIENALEDVERLSTLIRRLLLLSQSEMGQLPMHKTRVNLGDVVNDIVDQFQIPAEADSIKLRAVTEGQSFCMIDQTQMERVLTNLLSNALKYTPDGGSVEVSTRTFGNKVELTVKDSGVGIPSEHLPHIFDRFYRVPHSNPAKGLGLGLSFVASIVKAHQGEITVDSSPGNGSAFTVTLPSGEVPTRVPDLARLG